MFLWKISLLSIGPDFDLFFYAKQDSTESRKRKQNLNLRRISMQ